MTLDEALAALSPDARNRPGVRQMLETADRCAASRSGTIVRYIRPSVPALRVIFDTIFERVCAPHAAVPRLALRRDADARRALVALRSES